jgi:uncharacterized SAM-binding protein YcdF (DUF218 family)
MDLLDPFASLNQPLAQAIGLTAVGAVWLCFRRYRTAAAFFTASVLWLALCATPAFAAWLQRGLESQYPPRAASSYPAADAIVVLGGGELPHVGESSGNQASTARETRAGLGLELFRQGHAPIILLSGGDHEAKQMAHLLEQQHVPAAARRIEDVSRDTHQNALYSAALLKREKRQRILLVTSSWHMPRAAASFKRQGLVVIPAPTSEPPSPAAASWLPSRAALRQSARWLREYFGLWIYKLRGWA